MGEHTAIRRPILFSSAMVQAILAGRKTQTRRVIKSQPQFVDGHGEPFTNPHTGKTSLPVKRGWEWGKGATYTFAAWEEGFREAMADERGVCPYGVPGDRLWVRETWRKWENGGRQVAYAADLACYEVEFEKNEPVRVFDDGFRLPGKPPHGRWTPSIHMPRWASRITLEIEQVRVERIQEISQDDAVAEGRQCIAHLRETWDALNEKRGFGWEANPFVWVLTFKRVK